MRRNFWKTSSNHDHKTKSVYNQALIQKEVAPELASKVDAHNKEVRSGLARVTLRIENEFFNSFSRTKSTIRIRKIMRDNISICSEKKSPKYPQQVAATSPTVSNLPSTSIAFRCTRTAHRCWNQ